MTLGVMGVDGTTGRVLESLPLDWIRQRVHSLLLRPRPPRYGIESSDLSSAGWALVSTKEQGPRVRGALEPLLTLRRQQAGDRYRELTYLPGESSTAFRTRLKSGLGRVDPRQVPWYLLLVGSPEILPYGFELDLAVPHAVGRLSIENEDGFEDLAAYARRVVESETKARPRQIRSAAFAPMHPDDSGTLACVEHLARPLAQLATDLSGNLVDTAFGAAATRARLLEIMDGKPDLLLAAGHGVTFPADTKSQRMRQGGLVCADWPGPVQWPKGIPPEHTVVAEDLPDCTLEGAIALLFGCHTAGTPERDFFESSQPAEATHLTARPFVSALAQRLLGRRGGALAVVGHVGRAFEAAFLWQGVSQIGCFEDTFRALLEGRRLGEAMDGFGQRFAELAVRWMRCQVGEVMNDREMLDLWVAFHDASSWVLLGDPAVRLSAAIEAPPLDAGP